MKRSAKYAVIAAGLTAAVVMVGVILSLQGKMDEEHQHVYVEKIVEEATCNKPGRAEYTCVGCGDSYTEDIRRPGHTVEGDIPDDGLIHTDKCSACGDEVYVMRSAKTGTTLIAPAKSRGKRATVTVINNKGFKYVYVMYLQGGGYNNYSHYMKHHGCSNCALTSVLNATVPELETCTPDRVVEEIQRDVFGRKVFNKNYNSDKNKGKMPVTLYGMTKILDKYGVRYDLPSADPSEHEEQITQHLRNGDPVIVTFSKGGSGGLSNSVHTIDLLGIDADGYVIIGDSLHKKSKYWGDNGLFKPGRLNKITVSDILTYIKSSGGWTVSSDRFGDSGNIYYRGREDRGFLLVYGE